MRLELATSCAQGLVEPRSNDLREVVWKCDKGRFSTASTARVVADLTPSSLVVGKNLGAHRGWGKEGPGAEPAPVLPQ
jgi:hypothetical protein